MTTPMIQVDRRGSGQATFCAVVSRAWMVAVLIVSGLCTVSAFGDDVVRNGNRVTNVTIRGIEEGNLVYRAGAGDVSVPLEEIDSINLSTQPKLEEALDAFKAGRMRSAVSDLEGIYSNAETPWIKQFSGFYLAQAYDERGDAVDAALVYVYLARSGADPYLLSKPPVKSLEEASDNVKNRVRDEIMAVINETQGQTRDRLRSYLKVVTGEEAIPDIEPDAGDIQQQERAKSVVILPDSVWKLYESLGRNEQNADRWDAIPLLAEGKYQEALEALQPWLNTPSDLPEKLYLLGRIRLAIADQTKEKEDYLDAGLAFMRLYAHFGPQAGRSTHDLVYPAQLELAYIHEQIGREDIAGTLLNSAGALVNNKENYPEYRKRYYQILGEEIPADE